MQCSYPGNQTLHRLTMMPVSGHSNVDSNIFMKAGAYAIIL
jgi:hypothetical protein